MSAGVGGRLTMDHPDGADAVPADRARTEIGHAGLRPGREGRADVAALHCAACRRSPPFPSPSIWR
jgi:hypothetical protein